jgi:hypothetical protein
LDFFFLSCDTQSTKLLGIALGILQKYTTNHALCKDYENVPKLVNCCGKLIYSNIETQLKILQTLLLLFIHYPMVIRGKSMAKLFQISFELANMNDLTIKNTADATLKQLINLLFERVEEEMKLSGKNDMGEAKKDTFPSAGERESISLQPVARDAYLIFQDLCALVRNDPPHWIAIEGISKILGLDLMETVLGAHVALFVDVPEFLNLMKDKVCSLVLYFTDKSSFPHSMRMCRLVLILIRDFHLTLPMECEIFMSMLIKLLDMEHILWQRALAVEMLRLIITDEAVFYSLFAHFDMQPDAPNIMANMVHGMANHMQKAIIERYKQYGVAMNQTTPDHSVYITNFSDAVFLKSSCLEQFDKINQPPSIPDIYPLWLILQCVFYLGDNILAQLAPIFSQKSSTKTLKDLDLEQHEKREDIKILLKMMEAIWVPVLKILEESFRFVRDENVLVYVFKSYFVWLRASDILELKTTRNSILTQLCHLSVSESELDKLDNEKGGVVSLTKTNLLALRYLLSAASVLSETLEESWIPVLGTLQLADRLAEQFINTRKQASELVLIPGKDLIANEHEVLSFRQSLNKLFDNAQFLSHQGFFHFIHGLCIIISEKNMAIVETVLVSSKAKITKVG